MTRPLEPTNSLRPLNTIKPSQDAPRFYVALPEAHAGQYRLQDKTLTSIEYLESVLKKKRDFVLDCGVFRNLEF